MIHIMHYALSNLLHSFQYAVQSTRYLNNNYADTLELHTTVLQLIVWHSIRPYVTVLIN
jgi:hypothetical protein